MNLSGKKVLLTGATGGLGRAMAAELAATGAELILSSRKRDELEAMAERLPGTHRSIASDLADADAVPALIESAGVVDVLVANAGIGGGEAIAENDPETISRVVNVNLDVPIRMTAAALGPMRERGEGQIVLISSLAGKAMPAGAALYASTKAGLRAFGIGLRKDLEGTGIGVSVICPGFIREAGMFADSGRKPPPGIGTSSPEEVAEAVVVAIRDDEAEIDVAPVQQRGFANAALHMPDLMWQIERRLG